MGPKLFCADGGPSPAPAMTVVLFGLRDVGACAATMLVFISAACAVRHAVPRKGVPPVSRLPWTQNSGGVDGLQEASP